MSDDTIGREQAPTRYCRDGEREAIDLIRDSMSDLEFVAFCEGNAIKYNRRAGLKGPAEEDLDKAAWYLDMAAHVEGGGPDPRASRPDFQPYQRVGTPDPIRNRPKIPVLDHGFVRLVEAWGGGDVRLPEAGIIEAARQSTQGAFRGWEDGDAKLLRYLYAHKHSTPFEFAGMTLEVRAPIFIFRQWHRHRTQCLHPNTLVWFERPDNGRPYPMRIKDVWRKWQPTKRRARPERQTNSMFSRERIQNMQLRCLNEETGEFVTTQIVDVIKGEAKPMVTVTTGRFTLTATLDHRVYTDKGWLTLGDAIKQNAKLSQCGTERDLAMPVLPNHDGEPQWRHVVGWEDYYEVSSHGEVRRLGGKVKKLTRATNGYLVCSLNRPGKQVTALVHRLVAESFLLECRLGGQDYVRHKDSNPLNNNVQNLAWGTAQENTQDCILADRFQRLSQKFSDITSITDAGEHPSYDICVRGPWHNFVAEGVVVHNSYNEASGRYRPLPDLYYLPTAQQVWERAQEQGGNAQAGSAAGSEPLSMAATERYVDRLKRQCEAFRVEYRVAVKAGVPKEMARFGMPLNWYSQMRVTANLRNWLAFLTLRLDPHAQWEIRQYAQAVYTIVEQAFPQTAALFQREQG